MPTLNTIFLVYVVYEWPNWDKKVIDKLLFLSRQGSIANTNALINQKEAEAHTLDDAAKTEGEAAEKLRIGVNVLLMVWLIGPWKMWQKFQTYNSEIHHSLGCKITEPP